MTTPRNSASLEAMQENYKDKYGFSDENKPVFQSKKGITREMVEEMSLMKGEPDWDAPAPPQGLGDLLQEAHAHLGRRPLQHRL